MREKLRRNEDTINTIELKDSIHLYVYISPAFSLSYELHWRSRILFGVFVHDFTSINMSIRGLTSDTNLIFENFFREINRLMTKITKSKKFLKLVKKYIQIFSGCFEQFFDF